MASKKGKGKGKSNPNQSGTPSRANDRQGNQSGQGKQQSGPSSPSASSNDLTIDATRDVSAARDAAMNSGPAGESSIRVDQVDTKRRRMLVTGAGVVGGLGAVALAAPMVASMSPSERAKAAGAPVEADISKLEPGQRLTIEWRGKPVWILNRTPDALGSLSEVAGQLADPDSEVDQQPEYARNETRSIKPEILVMVGICTHLGCSPTYRPDIAAADLGSDWLGGFFCPCHGSKFDFAGRVYAGVPAPTNLEVPPYKYLSETVILVGVDSEEGVAA